MKVIDNADGFRLSIEFTRADCEALYTVATKIGGPIASQKDGHAVFDKLLAILREAGIRKELPIDFEMSRKAAIYFDKLGD